MNDRRAVASPPGAAAGERPVAGRIRRASSADLETLAALEARAFDEPWSRDQLAQYWAAPGALGWLAESADGGAVGLALFRALAGEAELLRVATAPEWRRLKVAESLLVAAFSDPDLAGVDCHLEVRADNAAAQALYLRLGFERSGLRKRYYRDDGDAWLYARRGPG